MKRVFFLLTLAIILTISSIITGLPSNYQASGYENHPEPFLMISQKFN